MFDTKYNNIEVHHCAGLLEGQRGEGEETLCCASSAEPEKYFKRRMLRIMNTSYDTYVAGEQE